MPGEGQLVYIAGHRTTYLAPFSHIDALRPGDVVTLEVPYGDLPLPRHTHRDRRRPTTSRVLRSHGSEIVALQACHPRFFASHRYIAYARLVRDRAARRRAVPRAGTHARGRAARLDAGLTPQSSRR